MAHHGQPIAPVDPRSVAPYALWSASMMAHSAVDPYWQAKVRYETAETPAAAAVIENACLSCHAPMQQHEARSTGGLRFDAMNAEGEQGVSCTVCHQIDPANLGKPESFTAGFKINDRDQIYGPHRDPFPMPMRMHTGRTPTYAPHMTESALCGTCHTVITPTLDAKGNKTGEFLEQATYLEWTASAYPKSGKTCQTCHMPQLEDASGEPVKQFIAHTPHGGFFPPTRPREPFGQHSFGGANVQMLSILADLLPGKRAILNQSAERARATLDDGLAMRLDTTREGSTEARVRLVNSAGQYPSGFPPPAVVARDSATPPARSFSNARGTRRRARSVAWREQRTRSSRTTRASRTLHKHKSTSSRWPTQRANTPFAHASGKAAQAGQPFAPLGFHETDDYALGSVGVTDDSDFRAGADTVVYTISVEPGRPWKIEAEVLPEREACTPVFDAGRKEEKAFKRIQT
ncbi:MAG: multiheme c-type cytochrome [Bryobacterales bacterium]